MNLKVHEIWARTWINEAMTSLCLVKAMDVFAHPN